MQISAANLLLASQQLRAAHGGRTAETASARMPGQIAPAPEKSAAAKATPFAPSHFETPPADGPKAAARPEAMVRPGSLLDIRV